MFAEENDGLPQTAADLLLPANVGLVLWEMRHDIAGRSPELERLTAVWQKLRRAAHEAGALTVLTKHLPLEPEYMLAPQRWRIGQRTKGENHSAGYLRAGGEGNAFLPGFEPTADELVVEKTTASLFHDTQADSRFRARNVRTLVLAGVATDVGVDFTARHAMALGYFVVLVEDGLGSYTKEAHDHAMAILRPTMFTATSDEIIAAWTNSASPITG